MADKRFFKNHGPFSLSDLSAITGDEIAGASVDEGSVFTDVAPLDRAGRSDVSFFDNIRYKSQFKDSAAGLCIIDPRFQKDAPAGMALLLSSTPYKSYALIAQAFYPQVQADGKISAKAVISESAKIEQGVQIEPGAVIGANAKIGAGAIINAGAVIGENVEIGTGCVIGANAVISHTIMGEKCNIYPGVCIGQDGFGFAIDPAGHIKVPQLGRVIIGDHVEIGANTTIDRGAGPDTEIGSGTWIDNQVQIGHNVKIGRGCVIVAQVGIAGSAILEDFVVVAAKSGIAGHLTIGMGARIGALSGVMRDVPPGQEQLGVPAIPAKEFMRQVATLKKLSQKKN